MTKIDRSFIEFMSEDSCVRGEIFIPASSERGHRPAVLLSHGWAMTAAGNLTDFALAFAEAGLISMTIDFRNLGRSDGAIRQDIDPYDQIEDIRNALTYLEQRNEVDPNRIGIWGSSFSGGHVLVVSAIDSRVKCAVSQVPTINGPETARINLTDAERKAEQQKFNEDRLNILRGGAPTLIQTVSVQPSDDSIYTGSDSYEYMTGDSRRAPLWRNETTLRSVERARGYIPGAYISEIAPTPLLMIIGTIDTTCPSSLQREAFEKAGEPKRLHQIEGGHYTPYVDEFADASQAAQDWFLEHL
ncbi:alpha/beta hydrolase [Leucobacter japonicus]|uniref:alpha/beta hydrolase n=1 Tax=Leucobacter japonicus TaxID=1461259 RepID=UPI0006A75C51|nr:alpha/beta hydrolase [Leucobacter japonicus]